MKPNGQATIRAPEPGAERRRELRHTASGEVRLAVVEPEGPEFGGRLMDVSQQGFRARHACHLLAAGQEVHFQHLHAAGRARVVWNRLLGGHVESGFYIVESRR